jgi:hypothetical protein
MRAPIDPKDRSFGAMRTRLVLIVLRIDEKDGRIRGMRTRLPLIRSRLPRTDVGVSKADGRLLATESSFARMSGRVIVVMRRFHLP